MASRELKHRIRDDPTATPMKDNNRKIGRKSRDKRMAMAKRGLRSLTIAVSVPLSLSLLSAYMGSSKSHAHHPLPSTKPFWFPPMWALHLTCPSSSFLMGLSAWMVWADGGFHRNPTAFCLYLAQLLFTLLWDPLVFGAGAMRLGLMVCLGMLGTMLGCYRMFGRVNSAAGDLIKPCLIWAAFLCIVNLKLISL